MRSVPHDDPEGPWIAVLCVGILLTSLAGTVSIGLIVLYTASLEALQPVLACFAAGAVLMLAAAAWLDHLSVRRTGTHRR